MVKLKRQEVVRSDKVKYPGVWVDEGVTWKDRLLEGSVVGTSEIGKNDGFFASRHKKKIYNACVLPHLVVHFFCSIFPLLPPRTPNVIIWKRRDGCL